MVLYALHQLYKELSQDPENGLTPDPFFEFKEVKWIILLNKQGGFIDVINSEKKYLVPREMRQTGSLKAQATILSDDLMFLLNPIKCKTFINTNLFFFKYLRDLSHETYTEWIEPVEVFINSEESLSAFKVSILNKSKEDKKITKLLDSIIEWTPSENKEEKQVVIDRVRQSFIFGIETPYNLPTNNTQVQHFLKKFSLKDIKNINPITVCLINKTKEITKENIPDSHKSPSKLGTAKLISFTESGVKNWEDAYASYALKSSENAYIDSTSSEEIVDSLDWLLGKTGNESNCITYIWKDSNGTKSEKLLFWSSFLKENQSILSLLHQTLNSSSIFTLPSTSEDVKQLFLKPNIERKLNGRFYLLRLEAKSKGRIAKNSWQETALEDIQRNIQNYHQQIKLWDQDKEDSDEIKIMPIKAYIGALKPSSGFTQTSNDDKEASKLATELTECILFGRRFPDKVLYLALKRLKVESKVKDKDQNDIFRDTQYRRIKLIQVYLLRIMNQETLEKAKETIEESLAYKFGRWFALVESVQKQHHYPDRVDNGVRERYFSSACSAPFHIFSHLTKQVYRAWLSKRIRDKNERYYYWFEKEFNTAVSELETEVRKVGFITGSLDLIEQSKFCLGYAHAKNEAYSKHSRNQESDIVDIQEGENK